jgi:hypothetical protein
MLTKINFMAVHSRLGPILAAVFLTLATLVSLASPTAGAAEKRQKVIDFEDEVVEGMNKRPLDSLSQISEADRKRRKPHLYRKRASFKSETAESVRLLRYTP